MSAQTVPQLSFGFLPQSPILVQPHEGQISSDGGLLLFAEFDRRWDYSNRMANCLDVPAINPHQPNPKPMTPEERRERLRQRLFGAIAGYEDCNDHDTLRTEPIFKMVAGRLPEDKALASQPTLSRFENSISPGSLQKLIDFLINTGIERLKQEHGGKLPDSIILDLDATDDPTHGHQQLTLFHGFYGQYQYYPLIISEPTSKHVFLAWLRPGTVHASLGADDDLMRIVNALRKERPDIRIHVRGDAAFGLPSMYKVCEENHLTYTFGFSTNTRLRKTTEALMDQAVKQYAQTGQKQRLFTCFSYQADSWKHPRTVVAKAECHANGTNLRFVVTNLPEITTDQQAGQVYDDYTQRGESEQRMDELKNGLCADRLSCHRFMANFFRLLMYTAAYNLANAVRRHPELPEVLRVGQPQTWRTHVIKVAAIVIQTARRVVVRLASNWPHWPLYQAAAKRVLNFSVPTPCVT
jgi:hypothetical protein